MHASVFIMCLYNELNILLWSALMCFNKHGIQTLTILRKKWLPQNVDLYAQLHEELISVTAWTFSINFLFWMEEIIIKETAVLRCVGMCEQLFWDFLVFVNSCFEMHWYVWTAVSRCLSMCGKQLFWDFLVCVGNSCFEMCWYVFKQLFWDVLVCVETAVLWCVGMCGKQLFWDVLVCVETAVLRCVGMCWKQLFWDVLNCVGKIEKLISH